MIRTPIYGGQRVGDAQDGENPAPEETDRDGYLAKLIKYVPGEVVAVFAAVIAASASVSDDASINNLMTRGVFFLFLLATPAYFWVLSAKLPKTQRPVWYFYVLSVVAFAVWGLAISDQVRGTLNVSAGLSEFLLAVGAFAIPFLDEVLTTIIGPKPVQG